MTNRQLSRSLTSSHLTRRIIIQTKTTPAGIRRPLTGQYRTYDAARTVAKSANRANGRGYRAIKARTAGYAVIFRPAVAVNRQRRVRSI